MLKVGIIGCGKIADSHAEQILRIPGCEIVGACDREELMARQLWERFPVKACYSDAGEMLKRARPDVVHITTPPGSHFELGCLCLQEGCHVYIEKPFTCDTGQAVELIRLAEETGVKVTAGHDLQFSHAARRFRRLVSKGVLGGPPVHMESYYGYELGGRYAKALLGLAVEADAVGAVSDQLDALAGVCLGEVRAQAFWRSLKVPEDEKRHTLQDILEKMDAHGLGRG